jgi:hypothetical protein
METLLSVVFMVLLLVVLAALLRVSGDVNDYGQEDNDK